ncbi:helix-turn-helix domain-containing protein [Lachnospiraceae bacterium 48-42]|jgi:Uncharacterized protein conserved in bacteria|nr:hypothetical protein [Dorea sp.]
MLNIELYRPIMEFLSLFLGTEVEIILCDTQKILHVENSADPNHYPGAPLSEMQQALIKNPECQDIPYNINYRTLSAKGEKMRSATMFIREGDSLSGLLTINQNVGELIHIRSYLELLINGEQEHNVLKPSGKNSSPKQSYEALTLSVTEMIDKVLEEATIRFNSPPGRLNADEKLSVIREMDSRGVFLAKGSVIEVAKKLKSSKATIYRYLQQLEKKE